MATDVLIIDDESAVRNVFAFYPLSTSGIADPNRAQFLNVLDTLNRKLTQS